MSRGLADPALGAQDVAVSTRFIRLPKFEEPSGYSVKAVEKKIEGGAWLEGYEYARAPDRLLVDLDGYRRWASERPR